MAIQRNRASPEGAARRAAWGKVPGYRGGPETCALAVGRRRGPFGT